MKQTGHSENELSNNGPIFTITKLLKTISVLIGMYSKWQNKKLKFIYFEKATKFCEISNEDF